MEGLLEITGGEFPPHTYFLNPEGKLFAYIRVHDDTLIEFKKPLAFYKSRRKFIQWPLEKRYWLGICSITQI